MIINKEYLINGPNNCIRLINKEKVLYIFGDFHLNVNEQTECFCNDRLSMDIDKIILLFMKLEKTKQYDLFAEFYQNELENKSNNNRRRYIDGYIQLFQNNLIKNKNEIKINPKYPNYRFHYTDIRNNILYFKNIFYFYKNNIQNKELTINKYVYLYSHLKTIIIKSIKSLKNNVFIKKILNKYSSSIIKKKIIYIYNEIVLKNFDRIIKLIDNLVNTKTIKYISKIDILCQNIFTALNDLYFIRRFLDKSYISNTILYTGLGHASNIIFILVKFFNFEITHVSYIKKQKNLNDMIHKLSYENLKYIDKLNNLLIHKKNNKIYQCTDISNFPDNFS
jgi:hypothetical protein